MTAVTELAADRAEHYADVLALVAAALADGDVERAEQALEPIAGERWEGSFAIAGKAGVGGGALGARKVAEATRAEVFLRDEMRCTSCGGRAIPRSILVAISDVFPDALPYYWRYKRGTVHPVYWALAAEADHIRAHSAGGLDNADNLTTLHAACNTMKSDSDVADLPLVELRGARANWDGLVSSYPALVLAGNDRGERHHALGYHRKRMRALGAVPLVPELDPAS